MSPDKFEELYVLEGSGKERKPTAQDDDARRVETRFWAMSYAKNPRLSVWDGVQRLYYCNDWDWILKGEDFHGAVRFPTLRDLIMALTDKYMEDVPEAELLPYGDEDAHLLTAKRAYLEYIQSSPHYKKVRRMAVQDMFFSGEGFIRQGFFDIRKQLGEKERVLYRDVGVNYVNYRNMFVDDAALTLHDPLAHMGARDVIIRTQVPYSRYIQEIAPRYGFKTQGVMAQPFIETLGVDYTVTNSREVTEKAHVKMVKLYEYENIETDEYIVVANGHTVFKGSLYECRGVSRFDLANYKFEPRNDSFWGQCLGELLAPHIYAKDTIFNLELMNLKLSLQPILAISGDFGYNPRTHVLQPGGVWTAGSKLQGKIGDNIQPIVSGNSNTSAYQMLGKISEETTITSRANVQSLEYASQQTATQTLEVSQSQNAHSARISAINEIEAETVIAENILDIMARFMTTEEDEGVPKRSIPIKNKKVRQGEDGDTMFFEKSGYDDTFFLTDKIIDIPVRVRVVDKRSQNVLKSQQMGRIMQLIPMVTNVMQADPEVAERISIMGLIEQAVDAIGLEHHKTFKENQDLYEDEFELLREEIILGNVVQLPPDESRKQSMHRMNFLLQFEKTMRGEMTKEQKLAFDAVMLQIFENIQRNHLQERYDKRAQATQQAAQGGMMPPGGIPPEGASGPQIMPGGQVPFAGDTAGMSGQVAQMTAGGPQPNMKAIPQPDPSVLNPSQRELN